MDSKEFREFGKAVIDFLADYMDNIKERDVLPEVEPGYLLKLLPEEAPEQPESWKEVLNDFHRTILPGITHWQSPRFHAFFPAGYSFPSMIGNMLSDGLGIVGFTWMSSPACTELEVITLNWLGKLLGLPEQFFNTCDGPGGGVIQSSASEATLVALLAAKEKTIRNIMKTETCRNEDEIKAKLMAYSSEQSNSSVEKACKIGSVKLRLLKSDSDGRLRGETLRQALEADRAQGLIPCYVVATLGTTAICAFDPLDEIGPVCEEAGAWLHVDAAYAGAVFICPEHRTLMQGIEYAASFVFNPHKWMLVNFDCSAFWVKDCYDLINAFDVQRVYLKDINATTTVPDYRHWEMPLGRRFRALKLWSVMRIYGAEGLRSYLRNHIALAQYFASLVRADKRFIVEPEPSMALVCFRLNDDDLKTKLLLDNITDKKKLFMIAAVYHDRYIIRLVVNGERPTKVDMDYSWSIIKDEVDTIYANSETPIKLKAETSAVNHLETINLSEKNI